MRRLPLRAAIAIAATCSALACAVACTSKDYGESDGLGAPDAAADLDTGGETGPSPLPDAAGGSCPNRYMPAEGTYSYAPAYAIDALLINDASVTTQAFKNPFFATVKHEPDGCWTLKAFIADGANGKHTHSWTFCNACDGDASTLDLVSEDDLFSVTSLGVTQTSHYECAKPRSYLVDGLEDGAVLPHGGCIGVSDGTQKQTIQTSPVSYQFVGVEDFQYAQEDATVPVHHFVGSDQLILGGSGVDPQQSPYQWFFDPKTGTIMELVFVKKTRTVIGDGSVDYTFTMVMSRVTSAIAPYVENP